MPFRPLLCAGILAGLANANAQEEVNSPNLITAGDMSDFTEEANPWGGVDDSGDLRGLLADQLVVDEKGAIGARFLSPSIAVGDFNGDGLADLVLADAKGFFWYYPNSGTKTRPKFTHGEVMPIWLGSPSLTEDEYKGLNETEVQGYLLDHLVPRIQLVDSDRSGKLDIIAGTYPGKLFYLRNIGSALQPAFDPAVEIKPTPLRDDKRLDCNYLSPFLYDWSGTGRLDLLRGEGTYSANSIFLYTNAGTNEEPRFSETNRVKVVPGVGREHLIPHVVDWNNDGKPDIISGEREGYVNLFLNTGGTDGVPTFDQGRHLKFGGEEKFGYFTDVATGAFSGNPQIPDVLIANDSGRVLFCHNTGSPGNPIFSSVPQPLKGTNPFPKILVPNSWALGAWNSFYRYPLHGWSEGIPYGVPYELLVVTNASQEPGFAPPQGVKWKNALKYELLDHKNIYFTSSFYPKKTSGDHDHAILYTGSSPIESETQYQFSFWTKAVGIHDISYVFGGGQRSNPDDPNDGSFNWVKISNPIQTGSSWTNVTDTISWSTTTKKQHDSTGFGLQFDFSGQGAFYIADVELHKL